MRHDQGFSAGSHFSIGHEAEGIRILAGIKQAHFLQVFRIVSSGHDLQIAIRFATCGFLSDINFLTLNNILLALVSEALITLLHI